MSARRTSAKTMVRDISSVASGASESPVLSDRVGIERAFEVIRHHTVHTKGYVATALQLIEEFGSPADKALLADLLRQNGQAAELATSGPPVAKKKAGKRK
jgi:hypothetical protein